MGSSPLAPPGKPLAVGAIAAGFLFSFIFWPYRKADGVSVPQPGMEPVPPAMEAQSPNH